MLHDVAATVNRPVLVARMRRGPTWTAWLAVDPTAGEAEVAVRVCVGVAQLRSSDGDLPADFEARVLAHIGVDTTLRDSFELFVVGTGRTLREILDALFADRLTHNPSPNTEEMMTRAESFGRSRRIVEHHRRPDCRSRADAYWTTHTGGWMW